MSKIIQEVEAANAKYVAEFGDKGKLALPPARGFAALVCMDARLDPAKFAGLHEGDAHVIRNAGGRASDDAIRSLVISHKLLGTQEFIVVHHTDCGMEYFNQATMATLLEHDLDTAQLTSDLKFLPAGKQGTGSVEGRFINWLSFKGVEQSVRDDINRIKGHPLVPDYIPVTGYVYDVKTGKLNKVN